MGMMVYFLLGIPKLETRSPGCSDSVLGMVMFVEWGCSELPGLLVQGKGGPTGQPPAHGCFPFSMVEVYLCCICWAHPLPVLAVLPLFSNCSPVSSRNVGCPGSAHTMLMAVFIPKHSSS